MDFELHFDDDRIKTFHLFELLRQIEVSSIILNHIKTRWGSSARQNVIKSQTKP